MIHCDDGYLIHSQNIAHLWEAFDLVMRSHFQPQYVTCGWGRGLAKVVDGWQVILPTVSASILLDVHCLPD